MSAWRRSGERVVAQLHRGARAGPAAPFTFAEVGDLPRPAARYLQLALTPGRTPPRSARIEHAGDFRTSLASRWSPFRSVQHVTVAPPGFVWDATIRMAPLVGVRVRDSYLGGYASMVGRIAGLIPVVNQAGTPELAAGALHRWLAEAVWVPSALLPRYGVVWEAVDDGTARATLADAGTTVSLDFSFAQGGEVTGVSGLRWRDEPGGAVQRPWRGRFADYREVDGLRIPFAGEVEWILPEGTLTYWRGRVTSVTYDSE